jgi:hypothetical protein
MRYRNGYVRRRRGSRFAGLFTGLFLLGMALLFSAIFVYPGWRARLSGVETQGTVVSVSDCPEDDSGGDMVLHPTHTQIPFEDNVEPIIRFTDGQGHTYDVAYNVCGTYAVGESLAIWYVPADPNSIFVPKDMGLIIFFTFMFGIMGLVGLVMLLWFVARFLFLLAAGGRMMLQGASAASYSPQMGVSQFTSSRGSSNHRIGEPVTVEDRWSVTPTRAYPSQGDMRASPAPGRYFLMLSITLRNISREPLYPGQGIFRLYDSFGTEYTRVQALESPLLGHIQPGASAALMLAFDVPGTQRRFRLSYDSSVSLLTQASWDIIS